MVADAAQEIDRLLLAEGIGGAAGIALGLGAFQEPGGGPPFGSGRGPHGANGAEFGGGARPAEILVKLGISPGLAADRERAAGDVAGGRFQGAAGGNEGADFALLFIAEDTGSAGHGGILAG
jgi:hypothetical protein